MEKEDFQEILENLEQLLQVGKKIQKQKDEGTDEIVKSLEKDYNDFFIWALGERKSKVSKTEIRKTWKKLHCDLPIPRVLTTDYDLGKEMSAICLFMDAYPLFLQEREEENED